MDRKDTIRMLSMHIHQDGEFAMYIAEENERLKEENVRMATVICEDRNARIRMYGHIRELEERIRALQEQEPANRNGEG